MLPLTGHLVIVGYLDNRLILVKDSSSNSLYAIDQHAAHERILLEHFLQSWKPEVTSSLTKPYFAFSLNQNLFVTLQRELSDSLLKKLSHDLENYGIQIHCLDLRKGHLLILSLPIRVCTTWNLPGHFVALLSRFISTRLDSLCGNAPKGSECLIYLNSAVMTLLQMKACKSAIRFGDKMEASEQHDLLNQLLKCSQPWKCAHGRPSVVKICRFA